MRRAARLIAAALLLAAALGAGKLDLPIPRGELRQGSAFSGAEVRAMQEDEFANPGMLWVTRGERLWREPAGAAGQSCASCHGDAADTMKAVATRYPRVDAGAGRLV